MGAEGGLSFQGLFLIEKLLQLHDLTNLILVFIIAFTGIVLPNFLLAEQYIATPWLLLYKLRPISWKKWALFFPSLY